MSQSSSPQAEAGDASPPRVLKWSFTLNNPTEEEELSLRELASGGKFRYLLFGREHFGPGESTSSEPGGVDPSTGLPSSSIRTPHFQGYFELDVAQRLTALKRFVGLKRAHLEPAMGSAQENLVYCSKEDSDPFVHGTARPPHRRACGDANRARYAEAILLAEAGNIDDVDPGIRLRCLRSLQTIAEQAEWRRSELGLSPPDIVLRPWQVCLESLLWCPPAERSILCYVDPVGGAGKSTFAHWLHVHYGVGRVCLRPRGDHPPPTVQVFHPSRGVDMARLVRPAKVFVVDCPYASLEYVPWATIEEMKNGFCTSTKYECQQKRFPRPHVILFLNMPVPEGKFSADRLVVHNLSVLE